MGHISKEYELKHEEHGRLLLLSTVRRCSMWKITDQGLLEKQNIIPFEQPSEEVQLLAFLPKGVLSVTCLLLVCSSGSLLL